MLDHSVSVCWREEFPKNGKIDSSKRKCPGRHLCPERGGTPGFLNKHKVWESIPAPGYGGLTVLSLDKSQGGIAKAMLYVRFFLIMG